MRIQPVQSPAIPHRSIGTSEIAEMPVIKERGIAASFVGSVTSHRHIGLSQQPGNLSFSFHLIALERGSPAPYRYVQIDSVQVIEHQNGHRTVRATIAGSDLLDRRDVGEGFRGRVVLQSLNDAIARNPNRAAKSDVSFLISARVFGKPVQFEMRETLEVSGAK